MSLENTVSRENTVSQEKTKSEGLAGRVAIITGSGRGIGRGIAVTLAQRGCKVVVNDKDETAVEKVVGHLLGEGLIAKGIVADISIKAEVKKLVDETVSTYGQLDILVNNAGVFNGASLDEMTEEQWDSVLNVDLKGTFLCTQAAAKYMRQNKFGRVINISSPDALIGEPGMANYIAAKAGIFGLTSAIVHDFTRWVQGEGCDMTCNCLIVGYNQTALTDNLPPGMQTMYSTEIPLGRPLDPQQDAGSAVAFLASAKTSYLTGAKISVTGGMYAVSSSY